VRRGGRRGKVWLIEQCQRSARVCTIRVGHAPCSDVEAIGRSDVGRCGARTRATGGCEKEREDERGHIQPAHTPSDAPAARVCRAHPALRRDGKGCRWPSELGRLPLSTTEHTQKHEVKCSLRDCGAEDPASMVPDSIHS
jgi:hypothetical protein